MRDYVARGRPEIAIETGRQLAAGFVSQTRAPGAEAEVDYADLWVVMRGVKTKTQLFTLRLSHSGKAVPRAFPTQGQEAFLEGHVYAFTQLGGVPTVHIRYDCEIEPGTNQAAGDVSVSPRSDPRYDRTAQRVRRLIR